jgi:hypothetical protein
VPDVTVENLFMIMVAYPHFRVIKRSEKQAGLSGNCFGDQVPCRHFFSDSLLLMG